MMCDPDGDGFNMILIATMLLLLVTIIPTFPDKPKDDEK